MATAMKNTKHQGEQNTTKALAWLWRFGWLRAPELGRMVWPSQIHNRKYAERLCRQLLDLNLVISRTLPGGEGTAYVLSEPGSRLLRQNTLLRSSSGKDWGKSTGGSWSPPNEWKHDLLSNGLLTLLFEDGWKIRPERELRRENIRRSKKIPDGLAEKLDENGKLISLWIEVEKSNKGGQNMTALLDGLIETHLEQVPKMSGIKPNSPCVAFVKNAQDSRSYFINHRLRITRFAKKNSPVMLPIRFIELELTGCGVKKFLIESAVIESDRINQIVDNLDSLGWENPDTDDATFFKISVPGYSLEYWKNHEDSFECEMAIPKFDSVGISYPDYVFNRADCASAEECKQLLANEFHKLSGRDASG